MSDQLKNELAELEQEMQRPDFWFDKDAARRTVRRYEELKEELAGRGKYDRGPAILNLFPGAGGDDAEDFVRMLKEMYLGYAAAQNWTVDHLHVHENEHGGYKNLSLEIEGKDAYGTLKNESGVHRLVRVSPFNAKKQRHTAFAMVEVVPRLAQVGEIDLSEEDIRVEFSKSGGPGGQNVNKRETAVRVVHLPTDIAVHADTERSQAQNREKALEILRGKLYRFLEEQKKKQQEGMQVSKTTLAEWGSQIRSYVLHPYQMVKDHRTGVEESDVDKVLGGYLDSFIEAESQL